MASDAGWRLARAFRAEFSSATAAIAPGSRKILVARSSAAPDPGTAVFLFVSDGDADVETAELTLLAFLAGSYPTALADFSFVP